MFLLFIFRLIICLNKGIDDSVFSKLQDSMLEKMSKMLIDQNLAADFINQYFRNIFSFCINSKNFNYALEPFFRSKTFNCLILNKKKISKIKI